MATKRAAAPRSRLWLRLALLAGAAAIVVVVILSGTGGPAEVDGTIGIEEPVRFKVDSAGCGYADVFLATGETVKPESGQFCVVRLELRNLDAPIHQLDASCQYMIDQSGARIPPRLDTPGLRTLADIDERLGPNEFRRASALYYDVPESTKLASIELHATCDSDGIRISPRSEGSAE